MARPRKNKMPDTVDSIEKEQREREAQVELTTKVLDVKRMTLLICECGLALEYKQAAGVLRCGKCGDYEIPSEFYIEVKKIK